MNSNSKNSDNLTINYEQNNHFKSRFRGVYRCGKRWKAQLQSQGVQYYLGTFDTEEEAARAYDRKARGEKGEKSLTNFNDDGLETTVCNMRSTAMYPTTFLDYTNTNDSSINAKSNVIKQENDLVSNQSNTINTSNYSNKKIRVSPVDTYIPSTTTNTNTNPLFFGIDTENSENIRVLWERLCQISQRLVLAKAAYDRLLEYQIISLDNEKEKLIQSINEEIQLLSMIKSQLEETISYSVSQGLGKLTSMNNVSNLAHSNNLSMNSTITSPINSTTNNLSNNTFTSLNNKVSDEVIDSSFRYVDSIDSSQYDNKNSNNNTSNSQMFQLPSYNDTFTKNGL